MQSKLLLHRDNFERGFLIDDEWMGSIAKLESKNPSDSKDKSAPTRYAAFVTNHETGETVGYREFNSLDEALQVLNAIPRSWKYESTSGCSGERCGEGKCKGTGCKIFVPKDSKSGESSACEPSCS
jgi:hypothetical protein